MNESAHSDEISPVFSPTPQLLEREPRVWDISDRQTDRQAGKPRLRRQTDSQHECEPKIKYRFNIPEASLPGRAGADLPTFSPLQGVGQRPGRLGPAGLVQSRLGKRLRYLLLGSPRPQTQGSRLPPGGGKPRPPQPPLPALLSLPPSSSPSLPLSLPRALPLAGPSRGQPVLDQIQVSPKEREREKRISYVEKKERKTLNRFYFPSSDHRPASEQTPWTRPCSCRGVSGLLPRPRGPPRPSRSALHTLGRRPPAAQTPNRPQGPSYRLNIRLPASRLASAREPALLRLRPKSTHHPPCPCSRAGPGHPLLAKAPAGPHAAHGPARDCRPPPLHGTHTKAQCPDALSRSPQSPAAAALHLCPRKAASPSRGKAVGLGGGCRGNREPRSQGGYRRSAGRSPSPRSPRDYLRDQGSLLGELLRFPPSPASLKHSHAESSAL